MSKPKTHFVKAAPGLKVPIPRELIVNSPIKFASDSTTIELRASSFVRKRLRAGDLIEVQPTAATAKASTKPNKTEG